MHRSGHQRDHTTHLCLPPAAITRKSSVILQHQHNVSEWMCDSGSPRHPNRRGQTHGLADDSEFCEKPAPAGKGDHPCNSTVRPCLLPGCSWHAVSNGQICTLVL
ncbi:hypothetical protein BLNAU_2142 [Blattamonas nauphoetae]|uniref:Uncharacterized protein n=1 Tax=Blattamonas nauphoetae TaxID=2049346 RepID=A0ABQ9YG47_9EUKA|nr:hypothetical protein BLNAU_2142 [Blattamonas nauphoetae]